MSGFINRTISGALILLITLICIYFKGYLLFGYVITITILCLLELFNTFGLNDKFLMYFSFLISIGLLYFINNSYKKLVLICFILYFLIISIYYLFFNKIKLENLAKILFCFIYISIPMGFFLKLGKIDLLWVVFFISWGTDTFAYLFGIIFGKHKLCSYLSPKKTVEGALGGIAGSLVLLNLFNYYFLKYNIVYIIILGILFSIISQIGDLFASKLKREIGIKDFGNMIKGHGGFLDRFDSVVFLTPLVYIVFYMFGGSY